MAALCIDWFGVCVPGRPVLANFRMIDTQKCVAQIERPAEISEVCFFLLPNAAVPGDMCAVLYSSADGGAEWNVLGCVHATKQSGIFRLPQPVDGQSHAMLQLGVMLEPAAKVQNLNLVGSGVDDRRSFARAIARDLMEFVTSFASS